MAARLYEQLDISERYAGSLFGCAPVIGDASLGMRRRLRATQIAIGVAEIYAPIGREHVFSRPIPDHAFRNIVSISPGGAITPLHGTAFAELKDLIKRHNIAGLLGVCTAGRRQFSGRRLQ